VIRWQYLIQVCHTFSLYVQFCYLSNLESSFNNWENNYILTAIFCLITNVQVLILYFGNKLLPYFTLFEPGSLWSRLACLIVPLLTSCRTSKQFLKSCHIILQLFYFWIIGSKQSKCWFKPKYLPVVNIHNNELLRGTTARHPFGQKIVPIFLFFRPGQAAKAPGKLPQGLRDVLIMTF
jgi:hypothetical protein